MSCLFDLEVSTGETLGKSKVKVRSLTLEELEKPTVFPDSTTKKTRDGHYYCPALFRDDIRRKAHIESVTMLSFDVDEVDPADGRLILNMLRDSGYECVIYSTFSHTGEPGQCCYRILMQPSREMSEREAMFMITHLYPQFGIPKIDSASLKELHQPMFLPMCKASYEHVHLFEYLRGKPVDIDAFSTAFVNDQSVPEGEDFESSDSYQPMAVPGACSEDLWLSSLLSQYTAKDAQDEGRYYPWQRIGTALYHQTDGRAFELWLKWSRKNEEYHGTGISESQMKAKWPSFKGKRYRGRLITIRYLLNKRTDTNRTIGGIAYAELVSLATNKETLKRLCDDIASDQYVVDKDHRTIATRVRKQHNVLYGDDISIGEAMQMIKPEYQSNGRIEYYYDNYVYDMQNSCYYSIRDKTKVPVEGMNYLYGNKMPLSNSGEPKVVHKVLTNQIAGYIKPRAIEGTVFSVGEDAVIEKQGRHLLNLYNPNNWPECGDSFDPVNNEIDAKLESMITQGFSLLCNDDHTLVTMLKQHLGHLRQCPNERIHWGYAISSVFEGAGKSTLIELYQAALGFDHCNKLLAMNIAEDRNEYAAKPVLMTFIEEFEFQSLREKNRAIKKMKDMITGDHVSIRKAYHDPMRMQTYTAYAIFSNDEYVLGHESTSRRWVPIIVEAANAEQVSAYLGVQHKQWFAEYYDLIRENKERVAAMFDSIDLTGFDVNNPPESTHKVQFIENTPIARCTRVINELIAYKASIDLTEDYARVSSVYELVATQVHMNKDRDSFELREMSVKSLRSVVERTLRAMGYGQIKTDQERFRVHFEEGERARAIDVFVKQNKRRFQGANALIALRNCIDEHRQIRLNGALPPDQDAGDESGVVHH